MLGHEKQGLCWSIRISERLLLGLLRAINPTGLAYAASKQNNTITSSASHSHTYDTQDYEGVILMPASASFASPSTLVLSRSSSSSSLLLVHSPPFSQPIWCSKTRPCHTYLKHKRITCGLARASNSPSTCPSASAHGGWELPCHGCKIADRTCVPLILRPLPAGGTWHLTLAQEGAPRAAPHKERRSLNHAVPADLHASPLSSHLITTSLPLPLPHSHPSTNLNTKMFGHPGHLLAFDQGGMNADMARHLLSHPYQHHHHNMTMDIRQVRKT